MDTDFMSRKSKHSLCYPLRIILDSILHRLCFLLKKGVLLRHHENWQQALLPCDCVLS